jgi:hypothetical protein
MIRGFLRKMEKSYHNPLQDKRSKVSLGFFISPNLRIFLPNIMLTVPRFTV